MNDRISDILSEKEVALLLATKYIGREILYFDSVGSTNDIALSKARQGCGEGLVVIAEEQVSGRGRLGRKWVTPKYASIAFSVVVRPAIEPERTPGITLVMGLAVCRAIEKLTELAPGIKWPNDIVVNRKKACGILTQMVSGDVGKRSIIIGTGINVNVPQFPEELKNTATSLSIESGHTVSRKELLARILFEFEELYNEFRKNGLKNIIGEFKRHSATLGRSVRVISAAENFEGVAEDITDEGILVVRRSDGRERRIISGDVSVRGINGYL